MTVTPNPESMHVLPIIGDKTPSQATYMAVAAVKECDALALPPLARTIDPDALDALVTTAGSPEDVALEIEYAGCSVTVTPDEVRVTTD